MAKKQREFVDKDREIMSEYYDVCEEYDGRYSKSLDDQMKALIEKDPDYLEPYLLLYYMLKNQHIKDAEKLLDEAYDRAIKLITNKNGNWPDILEWGFLENRHIIRTILDKAISLWINGKTDKAIDLFRKLLKTNPDDNPGVRYYILAIRMNIDFEAFEGRFNKGGFYDTRLDKWFDKNYKKFPDEFDGWEKAVEDL